MSNEHLLRCFSLERCSLRYSVFSYWHDRIHLPVTNSLYFNRDRRVSSHINEVLFVGIWRRVRTANPYACVAACMCTFPAIADLDQTIF